MKDIIFAIITLEYGIAKAKGLYDKGVLTKEEKNLRIESLQKAIQILSHP